MSQSTQLRQELKINPRLYQAMDLLYMPLLDLQQHLKQELLNNPFLDLVEAEEEDEEGETEAEAVAETPEEKERGEEIDWEEILLDGFDTAGGRREEHEEREYYEPVTVATPVEEIITSVNEMITEAAESDDRDLGDLPLYTVEEGEAMLKTVQDLDPPGVGARDLRECLLLQLDEAGLTQSVPYRLVRDCFDELIAHRWSEISKRFGISASDVQKAADEIAKLDPKPGLRFRSGDENYIIPDLIVDKIDGQYHVFLNDANLPRLRLSKAYQEIARDKKKFEGENKEFISNKLNSANWMIQAIEQRRQTMLKVMNYIVDRQREFFEKGVQFLKPLTLREVAEVINMHESTVSRVTNEKFVQTPRGVLPLKFFFSSGLATAEGDDVSARGIKAQLQKLVQEEDPRHPLTDQAIVNILRESGVQIARRTVAKYRDQLGVLSARMRKRI